MFCREKYPIAVFSTIQDHIQQTLNNHTYASHGYLCPYRASNVGGNEKTFFYMLFVLILCIDG